MSLLMLNGYLAVIYPKQKFQEIIKTELIHNESGTKQQYKLPYHWSDFVLINSINFTSMMQFLVRYVILCLSSFRQRERKQIP